MKKDYVSQIITIASTQRILRPRDLEKHGIPRKYIYAATEKGYLEKRGRGIYVLPDSDVLSDSLVEASIKVPRGVVCLISALEYHQMTTQAPHLVWMAIGRKVEMPRVKYPPMRFVRFSERALTAGIEKHERNGVSIKVYSPAKTIADCFKYRNKIGLDVAIDALKDCLRQKKCSVDEIWKYATIDRVTNVIKPYLEAIV